MFILFQEPNATPVWATLIIGIAGGLATLLTGIGGWWVYRHKTKGEGAQALAKGEQEEIHTSALRTETQNKIDEAELKRQKIPVTFIKELLDSAEQNSVEIKKLIDLSVVDKRTIGEQAGLISQQEQIISRQHGIINEQWNRMELTIINLGKEQQGHKDCLQQVDDLKHEVGKLVKRVQELELHTSGN